MIRETGGQQIPARPPSKIREDPSNNGKLAINATHGTRIHCFEINPHLESRNYAYVLSINSQTPHTTTSSSKTSKSFINVILSEQNKFPDS